MLPPLAERMRPKTMDDFLGQEHLVGKGSALSQLIKKKILPSIILWGPPGCGKTSFARLLSNELDRPFYALSAVEAGVKEVKEILAKSKNKSLFDKPSVPIVFIDEIHRFNKSQQDALLGAVEKGEITLVGATTENPSFEVIGALLSRCQVYRLEKLDRKSASELLDKAVCQDQVLKTKKIIFKDKEVLIDWADGDARKLLNSLEIICNQSENKIVINKEILNKVLQKKSLAYDKNGENHYDTISAFIKSIRGSNPDAAVYYLARMIEGGEDPKFIARRLLILSSEDVGLANPTALVMANATFDAVSKIGWPESRIILSQCSIYLATSPKSNSAYQAINQAQKLVQETANLSIPFNLRNAPTQMMKEMGYGKDYQYPHDFDNNFVAESYLPDEISEVKLYNPGKNAREKDILEQMKNLQAKKS